MVMVVHYVHKRELQRYLKDTKLNRYADTCDLWCGLSLWISRYRRDRARRENRQSWRDHKDAGVFGAANATDDIKKVTCAVCLTRTPPPPR
jgi:hypothetical protein